MKHAHSSCVLALAIRGAQGCGLASGVRRGSHANTAGPGRGAAQAASARLEDIARKLLRLYFTVRLRAEIAWGGGELTAEAWATPPQGADGREGPEGRVVLCD
eukprot:6413536-Prymnesium_polylepis.1